MFVAQRKYDSWTRDIELEQERDRQARYKAERERDEAKRGREEAERRSMESQKKGVVRALKWKFGVDAELPENWAEGRSYDELETIADKIFERASLQEALELLQ